MATRRCDWRDRSAAACRRKSYASDWVRASEGVLEKNNDISLQHHYDNMEKRYCRLTKILQTAFWQRGVKYFKIIQSKDKSKSKYWTNDEKPD